MTGQRLGGSKDYQRKWDRKAILLFHLNIIDNEERTAHIQAGGIIIIITTIIIVIIDIIIYYAGN